MTSDNGAQAPAAAAEEVRISYGVRVFAQSPDGFVVEIVADEADRPMEWLTKTLAALNRQKFVPVDPFPAPTINLPEPAAPAPRGGPPPGRGGGGRQNGPGGRQGGRQGGGGGAPAQYRGDVYNRCPWCGGEIYDNRKRKAEGSWRGPFFACQDRAPPEGNCGWAVWRADGTYDE